jgi:hypothetical protein
MNHVFRDQCEIMVKVLQLRICLESLVVFGEQIQRDSALSVAPD